MARLEERKLLTTVTEVLVGSLSEIYGIPTIAAGEEGMPIVLVFDDGLQETVRAVDFSGEVLSTFEVPGENVYGWTWDQVPAGETLGRDVRLAAAAPDGTMTVYSFTNGVFTESTEVPAPEGYEDNSRIHAIAGEGDDASFNAIVFAYDDIGMSGTPTELFHYSSSTGEYTPITHPEGISPPIPLFSSDLSTAVAGVYLMDASSPVPLVLSPGGTAFEFLPQDNHYPLAISGDGQTALVSVLGERRYAFLDLTAPETPVTPVDRTPLLPIVDIVPINFASSSTPDFPKIVGGSATVEGEDLAHIGFTSEITAEGLRLVPLSAHVESLGAMLTLAPAIVNDHIVVDGFEYYVGIARGEAAGDFGDLFLVTISPPPDTMAPTITALGPVSPSPSKFPVSQALPLVFSEDVVGDLTPGALALTRDGVAVPLPEAATITRTGTDRFEISGLESSTRVSGTYRLMVDPAGLADGQGNDATETAQAEFEIRRGVVPGDYDGDGIADLAVYLFDEAADAGRFDIQRSSDGESVTVALGTRGEIPVSGDFDGDGKNDVAVYNSEGRVDGSATPNAAVWTYIRSTDGVTEQVAFGGAGILDRPAPGDYDGDGVTDIATFRANSDLTPDSAEWFIRPSSDVNAGYRVAFGAANGVDLPAVADYDGDFKDDLATFRPEAHPNDLTVFDPEEDGIGAQWFLLQSAAGAARVEFGAAAGQVPGRPADQPALGDFDSDGRADITAFRLASDIPDTTDATAWFNVRSSANGPAYPAPASGGVAFFFAAAGDLAAQGDYDGDGRPDLAAFGAATRQWTIREGVEGPDRQVTFGPPGTSTNAVPVLAPLYFRLLATGNPVDGVGSSGGGDGLARFASGPATTRISGGNAPAYSSIGGLAGFGLASVGAAGPGGAATSAGASDPDREEAVDLALEDWA